MSKTRIERIKEALATLSPTYVDIVDQSEQHKHHSGAKDGGGHFLLTIVSNAFDHKTAVQRHRLIYNALGDLMKEEIHAISIQAKTPHES